MTAKSVMATRRMEDKEEKNKNPSKELRPGYFSLFVQFLRTLKQDEMFNGQNVWAKLICSPRNRTLFVSLIRSLNSIAFAVHINVCLPVPQKRKNQEIRRIILGFTKHPTLPLASGGWHRPANPRHHLDDRSLNVRRAKSSISYYD